MKEEHTSSDGRFKTEVRPIGDALTKVLYLEGVSYRYRHEEFPDKKFEQDKQVGFIAQNVEKIFPEIVKTDSDGYKYINYARIVPLLVESIKDLNSVVSKQDQQIKELQKMIQKQTWRPETVPTPAPTQNHVPASPLQNRVSNPVHNPGVGQENIF